MDFHCITSHAFCCVLELQHNGQVTCPFKLIRPQLRMRPARKKHSPGAWCIELNLLENTFFFFFFIQMPSYILIRMHPWCWQKKNEVQTVKKLDFIIKEMTGCLGPWHDISIHLCYTMDRIYRQRSCSSIFSWHALMRTCDWKERQGSLLGEVKTSPTLHLKWRPIMYGALLCMVPFRTQTIASLPPFLHLLCWQVNESKSW